MIQRHILLVEVETENPDLNPSTLQEEVLRLLEPLEDGKVAVVESREVIGIHRRKP